MEEKDIDKLFRAEKENEAFGPPAFVWDNLEQDLRRNKKKKRFFVWWLLGLLFISTTSYFLIQGNSKNRSASMIMTELESEEHGGQSVRSNKLLEDEKLKESALQNQAQNTRAQKSNENLSKEPTTEESIQNPSESDNLDNMVNDNNSTRIDKKIVEHNELIYQTSIYHNSSTGASSVDHPISDKSNESDKTRTNNLTKTLSNQALSQEEKLEFAVIGGLSFLLSPPARMKINLRPSYSEQIIKDRKLNIWNASLHIGKPKFSYVEPLISNLSTETDWYSYGLGISYQREVVHRLLFGAGLNLRQSKRKFNYESEGVQFLGYEPSTNIPSQPFEYGKLESQGEQRFTYVDFALSIQCNVWTKGIEVSLGLSTIVNINHNSQGKALVAEGKIVRYANSDHFYQSSLGLGFSPFVTFSLPIHEDFYLTLTPNFTSYLQNLKTDKYISEIRYSNIGLNVGVSWRF